MSDLTRCLSRQCSVKYKTYEKHINKALKQLELIHQKVLDQKDPRKVLSMMKDLQKLIFKIYMSSEAQAMYSCGIDKCKKHLEKSLQDGMQNLESMCKDTSCIKLLQQVQSNKLDAASISSLFAALMYESYKIMIQMEKRRMT